jgi:L-methionine (R)-S-oxide reductase
VKDTYKTLLRQYEALSDGEPDAGANAANLVALLFQGLSDVNWVGFYWLKGGDLVLGSFQGQPAVSRIPIGKGVCGRGAETREIQVVADVHAFPGHIACDPRSASECVVPILENGRCLGVLDIDSPRPNRFGPDEVELFSALLKAWLTKA